MHKLGGISQEKWEKYLLFWELNFRTCLFHLCRLTFYFNVGLISLGRKKVQRTISFYYNHNCINYTNFSVKTIFKFLIIILNPIYTVMERSSSFLWSDGYFEKVSKMARWWRFLQELLLHCFWLVWKILEMSHFNLVFLCIPPSNY